MQITAQTDFGTWLTYKNNAVLTDNLSFNGQYNLRSFDVDFNNDQTLITAGLSYKLASQVSFSGGYRHLYARDNFIENGMYQKIAIKSTVNKLKITNNFMVEERWINGDFAMRYRVGVDLSIPLASKLDLVLSEEVFLRNNNDSFDQNRLALRTNYKFNDALSLSTGIMHWQFSAFKKWVAQFTLSHTLDFRKKEPRS